ncbi:hypothetical protein GV819_30065 [Pseudomonas sp. Fl5BN2]|uniref:AidA/PixA family protein n=1 Tax=unclassified Pseudomonas TaxID=196821 RepID=UPI00137656EF|nr:MULTISPECIES: AidA/PixA family protein [unclassified Pseudomonas]NBF06527.1 hypothetical protein [Pseudomonas sp. Fl5BN2]NBF08969.1 hypothetical protein [Pseudomonas sp. Fl4BN1]
MSNIWNILVAIDAQSILDYNGKSLSGKPFNISQNSAAPTQLYNFFVNGIRLDQQVIHMISNADIVGASQGTAELSINVQSGDVIRWRSTSLSKGLDKAVLLYQYSQTDGPGSIGPNSDGPAPSDVYNSPLPLINTKNHAGTPQKQSVENFYWQGNAERPGKIRYSWAFMIVDSSNKVLGYCSWDPYIYVN